MTFASSSERPDLARGVVVEVALNLQHLPLVGFVRVCPSSDILRSRPLPTTLPLSSAFQVHPGRHVPSSWFRTTSTVCSALEVPGLLHPGTGRGSPRFRTVLPLAAQSSEEDRLASGQSQHFPAAPFTPPEEVPPTVAVPHRCGRCPLVVAPARPDEQVHHSAPTLDLEALLHCWVRSACPALPPDLRPLLPWASFPSRVLGE